MACGNARAAEENCGGRRDDGLHPDCQRQQQGAKKSRNEISLLFRLADDRQHSCDEQNVCGRISEAARRQLRVVHESRAEQSPDRNCDKDESKCKRPVARQEAAEKFVNEERKQQDEREIAEIAFSEKNVLDRAKISAAGTAVVENVFTALEETCKIAA